MLAVAPKVHLIADLHLATLSSGSHLGTEAEGKDGGGKSGELHIRCWK